MICVVYPESATKENNNKKLETGGHKFANKVRSFSRLLQKVDKPNVTKIVQQKYRSGLIFQFFRLDIGWRTSHFTSWLQLTKFLFNNVC